MRCFYDPHRICYTFHDNADNFIATVHQGICQNCLMGAHVKLLKEIQEELKLIRVTAKAV